MNGIKIFAQSIGYPENVSDSVYSYYFDIDGGEVFVSESGNRLIMEKIIDIAEEDLPKLAFYAAGRILREGAVLAWDERRSAAVLWQDVPVNSQAQRMVDVFEAFLNSCDWWQARATELNAPPVEFPKVVIRP